MRRTRTLLAALLALVAILGFAGPASAQEEGEEEHTDPLHEVELEAEENGASEFDVHCIEIIAEGGAVDDCQEAPNPLLPETNELIWGAFGFLVVFFFVWKMGFPAIKQGMSARADRIRSDLEAAESQRTEAESILADYRSQLADARNESARIIEEARQQADSLKKDQEQRLQAELTEMRQRATAEIETAKTTAIADLRGEVAQLAIGAAEIVVKRNLDQASQVQLIEDYINQVSEQQRS